MLADVMLTSISMANTDIFYADTTHFWAPRRINNHIQYKQKQLTEMFVPNPVLLDMPPNIFKHYLFMVCFPKTYQITELKLARCSQDLTYLSNNSGYAFYCNEWLTKFIAICSKMPRFVDERRAIDVIYLSFCSKVLDTIPHNSFVSKLGCYDLDG